MKILVCVDGSEQGQKALEKAVRVAEGCDPVEVAILHVYDQKPIISTFSYGDEGSSITRQDWERFEWLEEERKEQSKKILSEALKVFEGKNIKARTIFMEGHASETITKIASEEGFDMIVMGSRGAGGLKKFLLGSVSSAVANKADTSVLIVK